MTTMNREDIHIKYSAAYDAKCDNCGKRKTNLHQVKTPHWTKYFCDRCGSWFVTKEMVQAGEGEKEVQKEFEVSDDNNDSV